MKLIDIIIPVYNAPEELRECVESILRHNDATPLRLVIINDCSPDPEVNNYLTTLSGLDNIIVLENEKNLGFVGTVNKGMLFSDNDVVLLNSDTVVTKSWLRKLKEAAYSHESVATVTPFTNNGTICSIPNFCEDNEIPDGFNVDSFAEFVEKVSERVYPELPTAVGFCMYIKREIIQEIGVFDAETFGKGYGEENDFCCRAIEHGFKNILADDIFIYHKGSMSFQGEKAKLIEVNLKKLNQRYSYYEQSVHDFIHLYNPLKLIHDTINLRMSQYKYSYKLKGNILFLMHNFFDQAYNHPVGGTEYHVKDLTENLPDYNVYILVSSGMELVLKHYRNGKEVNKYRFGLSSPITITHFHHREYSQIFTKILNTFEISMVHIHHLIKHSFDAPHIAREKNIPVYFTLHDFYLFCPRINLLDQKNEYCIEKRSVEKCASCLQSSHFFHTSFLSKWKHHVKAMFEHVDLFFVPSNSTADIFNIDYPEIRNRLTVIEHGFNWEYENNKVDSKARGKLSVGFLGGLSPTKGSKLIYDLVTTFPKDLVEWHLIGGIGDQKLNLLNQSNVIKHGSYKREDLTGLLEQVNIDLIALLSPWPETYSYTLSEAWKHNIPVIVTPMGALKERVESVNGGWITEGNDLKSITDTLNKVLDNFEIEKPRLINNINGRFMMSNKQMANSYIEKYQFSGMVEKQINPGELLTNLTIKQSIKYYISEHITSEVQNTSYTDKLEHELYLIKSTIGYKVLERLRNRHNWVTRIGKKVIYNVLKYKNRH